jgi:hypothetical protein
VRRQLLRRVRVHRAQRECEGTCHGSCDVEFEAPKCEGKLTGPECDIDAECEANCEAEIQAELVCEPPKVTWNVVGTGTADLDKLAAAIETNLPDLIAYSADRADAIVDVAGDLEASGRSSRSSAAGDSIKAAACVGPRGGGGRCLRRQRAGLGQRQRRGLRQRQRLRE